MTETTPGMGHNSNPVSGERLRSFVKRIEKLEEDKAAIAEDIKDIYLEAKGTGFDVKILRQCIRLRKMKIEDRQEQEELLDMYMSAIGDFIGTPLGQASARNTEAQE